MRSARARRRSGCRLNHAWARNQHLLRVIALMEASIEDPLSTADIALDLGISTRQLERLFGKYPNNSPKA